MYSDSINYKGGRTLNRRVDSGQVYVHEKKIISYVGEGIKGPEFLAVVVRTEQIDRLGDGELRVAQGHTVVADFIIG